MSMDENPRCKPLLKTTHKRKTLDFPIEHLKKPDDFFNQISWSDESKIELFSPRKE
ncbi:UNVERIFIED_CONTAM: hypothetical protein FKN15_005655 [Acipenser sinensis]